MKKIMTENLQNNLIITYLFSFINAHFGNYKIENDCFKPFLTGSRSFDCWQQCISRDQSDYDIVILFGQYADSIGKFKEFCDKEGIIISDGIYNNSVKFKLEINKKPLVINLIPLAIINFLSWQFATNTIISMIKNSEHPTQKDLIDKLRIRNSRIALFETLTAFFKNTTL